MKLTTLLILFGLLITQSQHSSGQEIQLSPEGLARKSAHAFLIGEYSEGKKSKFKGNGAGQILDEIVVSTERVEVNGDVVIDLPPGTARVATMFRYIVLRGEGLENLEGLRLLPYAPNSNMPESTQTSKLFRVKVAAMPIPSESMPPAKLKTKTKAGTKATITEIAFNSQSKLSTTFDDIPYRNLGAEYPREKVDLKINLEKELSIAGHIDLEREKFCRYYAAPGNLDASFENWAKERNFLPGRQIFKFQPALVVGYSKNQPKLTESKSKPGAADLSFFEEYKNPGPRNTIEPFQDIKYAMCFNDYPEFMSVKQVGRGTPLIEHFDDAAELAAAFIADQIKDGGRSATYWEVKNESTIKSEWDYHFQKDKDSWALMADFHSRVADAVHKSSPGTMVGGPSSAWMQLQVADFGLYRNQLKFMDLTKGRVDFYSHHFYEDFGSIGAWERREGKYTNYLLGRMEAILNMIQAHMHETENVRPILITECGSLQPGRGPSDYWLRLRSYSAYMHKMMQRPDQIELGVPFVFLSIPWNPKSGDTAFIPKEGERNNASLEKCDSTPVKNFFELWRDFDGRRLPVSFKQKWLDVTAVHQENRIQLAMTNMGGRRLSVNVASLTGEIPIKSVSQKRLFYLDGLVKFEDNVAHTDATSIPIDVEETTIVTIELTEPLAIAGTLEKKSHYAAGTAIKSVAASKDGFAIRVDDTGSVQSAKLIVGVQRKGGLGGPLSGTFNGKPFKVKAAWASEFNNLFASIDVKLPIDLLAADNTLKIDQRDGLTITSVHIETEK
jgi:agarase